jgi:hypothetical protein
VLAPDASRLCRSASLSRWNFSLRARHGAFAAGMASIICASASATEPASAATPSVTGK